MIMWFPILLLILQSDLSRGLLEVLTLGLGTTTIEHLGVFFVHLQHIKDKKDTPKNPKNDI